MRNLREHETLYAAALNRLPRGTEPLRRATPIAAAGKLLTRAGEPFYLRGVTYGTFAPDENGDQFPAQAQVASDFRAIAGNGFNVVRLYTMPPQRVLDA